MIAHVGMRSSVAWPADASRVPRKRGSDTPSMASANVQLMRRTYEAFNAGGVEAALALNVHAEDLLIYPTSDWPDDEVYRGHDGLRALYHAWTAQFEGFT